MYKLQGPIDCLASPWPDLVTGMSLKTQDLPIVETFLERFDT